MSDNEKTLEIEVVQGTEGTIASGELYGADQARAYADEAGQAADRAKESQNLAEAWAHSDQARPEKAPGPVKPGPMCPKNGQKAPGHRTTQPAPGVPRPGLTWPGNGLRAIRNRTG